MLAGVAVVSIATGLAMGSRIATRSTIGNPPGPGPRGPAALLVDARNDATSADRAARQLPNDAVGNVGRDPELKMTSGGQAVCAKPLTDLSVTAA